MSANSKMMTAIIMALLCVVVFILIAKMASKRIGTKKYDERQMAVRGRGYMYAFFVSAAVSFVTYFMSEETKLFLGSMVYFLPFIVGLIVHVEYCLWNDAYLELNYDSKGTMGSLTAIGGANLLLGLLNLKKGLVIDGELNTSVINLIFGILIILIAIQLAIKSKLDKREVDEDEES